MVKAETTIIAVIIFFSIFVIATILFLPSIQENIKLAQINNEVHNVKTQISNCNSKLLETARTGIKNTCYIPAELGKITAKQDGIYYTIQSDKKLCDLHDWIEIDEDAHLWTKCSNNGYVLQYMWSFPSPTYINGTIEGNIYINSLNNPQQSFQKTIKFRTITVVVSFNYIPGQEGKTLQISRDHITDENVTLSVLIS